MCRVGYTLERFRGRALGMFSVRMSSTAVLQWRSMSSTSWPTRSFWPWLTTETLTTGFTRACSGPEAHDVVLAEVAARLHLDEIERQLPGVLEPVLHPDRNEHRFVLRNEELVLAARDLRRPRDHDPVLGAVVVHLQRKRRARLHHDALHLEALAGVDALVVAPRAVHARV